MSVFSIYRLAMGNTDCSRVPVLLFSCWNWMGAEVCCTLGMMQTIVKAGWCFFYTGYSFCTRVSQTKSSVHVLKPKAHLIDSGLQMQELNCRSTDGLWLGRNFEAFWFTLFFVQQHLCDSVYMRSVHLRTAILYMLRVVFMFCCLFWHIEEKIKILPWRIQKAQSLTDGVQGHVGLCPALTLLHEGHNAHQFFLIAFWYKLEHFVFSLTGVVLP